MGRSQAQAAAADLLRTKGLHRVGPYMAPRTMCSTVSACLATSFAIKGLNFSVTSAGATSAHCIGVAAQQIAAGHQDVIFAGGGEELDWNLTTIFDAMGALSTGFNAEPHRASRAYDAQRDGFVIAGGGGMLVLEALDHAHFRQPLRCKHVAPQSRLMCARASQWTADSIFCVADGSL